MVSIILGMLLIIIGVWGLSIHWWAFLDLVYVAVPLLLLIIGVTALMAGISGYKARAKTAKETENDVSCGE